MHHRSTAPHQSIAHDFFTFGNDGIGLHLAAERRAAERARRLAVASRPRRLGGLRQRLGTWLVATGQEVLGECVPVPHASGARG